MLDSICIVQQNGEVPIVIATIHCYRSQHLTCQHTMQHAKSLPSLGVSVTYTYCILLVLNYIVWFLIAYRSFIHLHFMLGRAVFMAATIGWHSL